MKGKLCPVSLLPCLLLLLASPLLAGDKAPAYARADAFQEVDRDLRLSVQPGSGSIEFTAVGWPGALNIHGKGSGPGGTIAVHGRDVSGALSLDLATLDSGIDLRTRHMKDRYLEVAKYPQAELHLLALALPDLPASGELQTTFEGSLSLHGVTRPVHGSTQIRRKGEAIDVIASFEIHTNEYGIESAGYMGITVAEKVKIRVQFSCPVPSVARAGR